MSKKVDRSLVQGTVTFTVSCNDLAGLVESGTANSNYKLKEWLQDKAFKHIDCASVEVEIDNIESVTITEATADKYTDTLVSGSEWKEIKRESNGN